MTRFTIGTYTCNDMDVMEKCVKALELDLKFVRLSCVDFAWMIAHQIEALCMLF